MKKGTLRKRWENRVCRILTEIWSITIEPFQRIFNLEEKYTLEKGKNYL
jgi:hypothetical protein